ncbi:MAG: ImmA/IrrE family metallo-endopeptidase [bacterium]|nr:ImmA/IrrE family metallo-endopeptidase [bacterium]
MDTDQLPPTEKGRHHEVRAMALREFAGLKFDDEPLNPFALAKYAKLYVATFEDIEGLSEDTRRHLLEGGKDLWSGGAASAKLSDGSRLIILNPTHGRNRHNATLMEEICHVFLGHKPSRLAISNTNKEGKTIARDYNAEIEEEAYGTGAAALLPFTAIKRLVLDGRTVAEIARHFNVSRALVEYRLKISRLWSSYKENVFSGPSASTPE